MVGSSSSLRSGTSFSQTATITQVTTQRAEAARKAGCRASASAVHAAFQWVLDPDGDADTADAPGVVNASWGEAAAGCPTAFQPDLQALQKAGIAVVVAAGNATVPSSPGTVGCITMRGWGWPRS